MWNHRCLLIALRFAAEFNCALSLPPAAPVVESHAVMDIGADFHRISARLATRSAVEVMQPAIASAVLLYAYSS